MSTHDKSILSLCDRVDGFQEAHFYLESFWRYIDDNISLGEWDDGRSLKVNVHRGGGDCEDYALSLMALLSDEQSNSCIIYLKGERIELFHPLNFKNISHATFCIEENGLYGLAKEGLIILPTYDSVDELIKFYCKSKNIFRGEYSLVRLSHFDGLIDSEENLREYIWVNSEMSERRTLSLQK